MNELHLRLFISVRCRRRRPGLGDWETGGRVKSVIKDRKRLPKALTCHYAKLQKQQILKVDITSVRSIRRRSTNNCFFSFGR